MYAMQGVEGELEEEPPVLHAFDLALYTEEYKRRASHADVFRGSLDAWNRFAATKPLLYLPGRSTNADFDTTDRKRHLWTHTELDAFGEVVETRTQELLQAQESLLKSWHFAATQVERVVRGFLGRQRVKRIVLALSEIATQLELANHLAWLRKKQVVAAVTLQITYRRHARRREYVEKCRVRLQRTMRLFLFRLHRMRATRTIQKSFRSYRYRQAVLSHLRKLCKVLKASRQKQQADQLASVFKQMCDDKRRCQQEQLWEKHPEKMHQLRRVQQRKQTLDAVLPQMVRQQPLMFATKPVRKRTSSRNASLNQAPSLPTVHKS